jgi:hypothetical protein
MNFPYEGNMGFNQQGTQGEGPHHHDRETRLLTDMLHVLNFIFCEDICISLHPLP